MKKKWEVLVRQVLRAESEGVTVTNLSKLLNGDSDSIRHVLGQMPDAYIDRWVYVLGQYAAVWCVVVPPENCPKPNRREDDDN